MSGTILSASSWKLALGLGLWGLASWLVLQLHDAPIAHGHSICGPWGCGPTIPALMAAHGFWLVTLLPLAFYARSSLSTARAILLGRILVGLCVGGIAALMIWESTHWPSSGRAELRAYTVHHGFFALATLIEVPLLPGLLSGLILARTARRMGLGGTDDGCGEGPCGSAGTAGDSGPAPNRIEVGRPFPRMGLPTHQDKLAFIPDAHRERISILYFMRAAGCSICRGHVRRLAERQAEFHALGGDIYIIHPGNPRASRTLADSLNLRFPIVSSRDSNILAELGQARRLTSLPRSGTLLIDRRGVVRSVRLSFLPHRGFHEAELLADLRRFHDEGPSGHDPSAANPL